MVCYFFGLIFVIMVVAGCFWPVSGFTDTLKSQGRLDHYGFESSLIIKINILKKEYGINTKYCKAYSGTLSRRNFRRLNAI